jgi:uncharacterized protein YbjT (DUF2867 family)
MKDKLVTLFGGGGFVGRYVAQALLASGARVRIAQRDPRQATFLKPLAGLGQTQFIAADLTRPASVARAVDGADGVINCVGAFANMQALHVDGARRIAEAARDAGAEALVHISAIGADPSSASAYARTKGEGETAVREAFPRATILRPSIVFGQEDQFTNRFAGLIAGLPAVPVFRSVARFQPVFVKDVAAAAAASVADPGSHAGQTYELGGPDVLTMAEIHRSLATMIGRKPRLIEVPDAIGSVFAAIPGTPISRDQWLMLQRDTVVSEGASGLAAFGIVPTPMAAVAPQWLVRFRRHGRFGQRQPA